MTMKQVAMDDQMPYLPKEIIQNILARLPARFLIRFLCVCKQWKNLIKSPSFSSDHLLHSSHQNPCLLFLMRGGDDALNWHLLDSEMQVHRVQNHPLIDYLKCGWVVGSSNGLLCVRIRKDGMSHDSLLLCNPTIREVRQLPRATDAFPHQNLHVGFGFSPIVNDYKIVRIYVDIPFDDMIDKVLVYSLRTESWKEIELGILVGVSLSSHGFTANGSIFWFGSKLKQEDENGNLVGGNVIISFDIATEVFTLMPRPALTLGSHLKTLTMYEKKLAVLCCTAIGNSKSLIDLWVMEEGTAASGQRCSWTKKYSICPYPGVLRPLTIWRNEVVCSISTRREMENDETNTILYNLTTKEFKKFAVSRCSCGYHVFNHVESLLPVGGMKLSAMFV
ncbi:F-box protein At3g07870-like [Neltuma alba]|uniref:F-box protein At3g07870-like n=1 Tax=Neltuma alba TaxID=207710 RepID=UPI0010A3FE7A|nr:F-box protein At3g07870-like [Prosopis alba]